MSRIGALKYERSECFKRAILDIFRVRNDFFFCRNREGNVIFSMFLTFRAIFSVAYSFPQPNTDTPTPKMIINYSYLISHSDISFEEKFLIFK